MKKFQILKYKIILIAAVVLIAGIFIFIRLNDERQRYVEEVVVTPTAYIKISQDPSLDTTSWKTYEDKKLKFTMKYPSDVMIDPRQSSEGRLTVFIFEEDKKKPLPGKVTSFYIADTGKKGVDGFSAFRRGDCGKECKISYKNVPWININNFYGIKNPLPGDVLNYYLTDKKEFKSVVNFYAGGYTKNEKTVQDKITTFEQMVRTVTFVN